MDSCGWTRMGNEDGEGMAGADVAASWQQCYSWCTPYSHPHPHHHPHHPRQYQGSQYQQLPGSASAATNASTHYPSSQQHPLQLQSTQPPPLDQQQHFHPIRGQGGLRRVPYDGSEKDRIEGSRKRGGAKTEEEKESDYYDDLYPAPASSVRNKQRSLVILKRCIIRCSEMERLGQRP
ncbi:hypothetical protein ALC60_09556 [Trachymyrmex zeteki]|uniref:Uncharacterized protein n=1 Tax=Mycetomoellerius zeteki TaxID=64791 RepID=A0A151WU12_9HYME|nr:hypothetical protein ALC60_09556 [Trachymyrmex zeteki]